MSLISDTIVDKLGLSVSARARRRRAQQFRSTSLQLFLQTQKGALTVKGTEDEVKWEWGDERGWFEEEVAQQDEILYQRLNWALEGSFPYWENES